jgi:hypothetical protein
MRLQNVSYPLVCQSTSSLNPDMSAHLETSIRMIHQSLPQLLPRLREEQKAAF